MSTTTYSQLVTAVRNIAASSDANDADSLANAIGAARDLVEDDEPVYTTEVDVARAVERLLGDGGSYELAKRVHEYMRDHDLVTHNGRGFVIARDTNVLQIAADLSGADAPYPADLARADRLLTADELQQKYGTEPDRSGDCGEHPQYSLWDWRQIVAQRSTVLGYWQWVESRIEQDAD